MRRHRRLLTSILALLAMTFPFVETVAASVCSPEMVMGMEMHQGGHAHGGGAAPAGSHDGKHGESGEEDTDCPFGPMMTGCAGVAPLASRISSEIGLPSHADRPAFSESTRRHLLLADALFRPPRA